MVTSRYIKIFFLIFRTDLKRLYNRFYWVLNRYSHNHELNSITKRRLNVCLIGIGVAVISTITSMIYFPMKAFLTEGISSDLLSWIRFVLLIHILLGFIGCITRYERAIQPEDYEIISGSPVPAFLFVVNRFVSQGLLSLLGLLLFLILPLCITSVLASEVGWFSLIVFPILGMLYILFYSSISGVAGYIGYRIMHRWKWTQISIFSNSVFFTILGFLASFPLVSWFLDRTSMGEARVVYLIRGIAESNWVPTNWFIEAIRTFIAGKPFFLMMLVQCIVVSFITFFIFCRLNRFISVNPMLQIKRMKGGNRYHYFHRFYLRLLSFLPNEYRFILDKDIKSLTRISEMFRYRIIKILYLFSLTSGLFIGLGMNGARNFVSDTGLLITFVILSSILSSLIGTSLLGVTSIDSESSNINLFLQRGFDPKKLIISKVLLQVIVLLFSSTIFLLVLSLALSLPIYAIAIGLSINTIVSIVYGSTQVQVTAVYPRFDWEHYSEIGRSSRSVTLENILTGVYFVFILQGIGVFATLHHFNHISVFMMFSGSIIWCLLIGVLLLGYMYIFLERKGTRHWEGYR
ncbi:hypothetical protein [Thermoactinomyces sp. DSM 45892]|uniref:hypothetical protein n=1 Tax=Thermoactinomyces sp. DSM 45892 TaxID=1882753 RepID=UPI00089D4AC8|nr:hypothetical protein [Thermoactinomyces sp. DSM 45892]SDY72415.1 ABC-2 type transport system permease protein [Thermoactinomyces sp. DSM 45892]